MSEWAGWRFARLKRTLIGRVYSATIWLGSRIASPEMLLNTELLPHVNCYRMARERRGGDEAIEHGDAHGTEVCFGGALLGVEPCRKGPHSRRVRCDYRLPSEACDAVSALRPWRPDSGSSQSPPPRPGSKIDEATTARSGTLLCAAIRIPS